MFRTNEDLIIFTCCIFSKFNDGLEKNPSSSAKTTRCFFLEWPSLVYAVGLTLAENAECLDKTVTLPGGLELSTSDPLFLLQSSFISSSLDELSLPDANCWSNLWVFTWDHFRFSAALLSLVGISMGKNPLLSSLLSLSVLIFSFAACCSTSPAKDDLIFKDSSWMLLLWSALSADGWKENDKYQWYRCCDWIKQSNVLFDYLHLSPSIHHLRLYSPLGQNFPVKIPEKYKNQGLPSG